MLTVKKFANVFDLSLGGYFSGFIGIILALLTILELPPDMVHADDDDDGSDDADDDDNSTDNILTTLASVTEGSTESEIAIEKRDELNDTLLGVNITLIFFGWLLLIASVVLIYATLKRQSKLVLPYIIALFSCVLLVILLELLPEFIDELGLGYFLMLNVLIAITAYVLIVVYSLYTQFAEEELNKIPY
ncbi:unnamed protein product [Diamesa hyperborea]